MTPQEAAAGIVAGVMELIQGDNAYKAEVIVGCVDQLIGSDPHAILDKIPGLTPDTTELLSDALLDALRQAIVERLQSP